MSLRMARVLGDVVGMVEAASRRNKGVEARSPSQIYGSGEGGFSRCGRLPTWAWSSGSLFGCRRTADAVVFPSVGRGGEGVEEDGATVFLVRPCLVLEFWWGLVGIIPTKSQIPTHF
jgi:hypothetical protein